MLDYRPDLDPRTPGLLTSVTNMLPSPRGYISARAAVAHTAHTYSLAANEVYPNKLFASRWLSAPGGIVIIGTNQKLNVYEYTNGFINVSKAGNYNLAGSVFQWGEDVNAAFDICAFGDVIIAVNKAVATQRRSALDLTIATLFADLAGAPAGNTCCVAANFVFIGDCGNWSTVTGSRDILAWSAIGDYTDWAVNPTVTQASYAQFNDTPGAITCVRPFRDGVVVFKADSMYYGRYVGAGTNSPIWDFVRISDRIGCLGHRSVVDIDNAMVFVGRDDVYKFDGTQPTSITNGIYEALRSAFAFTGSNGNVALRVGHDKGASSVWLATTSSIYVWNYRYNRWGSMSSTGQAEVLCQTNSDDFRTKTLSTVTAGVQLYTNSDNHNNLNTLSFYQGSPLNRNAAYATNATVRTGWLGEPNKLHTLSRVNPIYARAPATVANASVAIYTSKVPAGGGTLSTTVAMNTDYRMDTLSGSGVSNNFFQLSHVCSEFHEIADIVPTFVPAGAR